jgi:hypothetical protein
VDFELRRHVCSLGYHRHVPLKRNALWAFGRRETMSVDERARHRLYLKLEELLGPEEAGTLMDHLPPAGFANLATKDDVRLLRSDLGSLEHRLTAKIERLARTLVVWTSSMVLASAALAFAVGRFA